MVLGFFKFCQKIENFLLISDLDECVSLFFAWVLHVGVFLGNNFSTFADKSKASIYFNPQFEKNLSAI